MEVISREEFKTPLQAQNFTQLTNLEVILLGYKQRSHFVLESRKKG
jgi:hypothetical protein